MILDSILMVKPTSVNNSTLQVLTSDKYNPNKKRPKRLIKNRLVCIKGKEK